MPSNINKLLKNKSFIQGMATFSISFITTIGMFVAAYRNYIEHNIISERQIAQNHATVVRLMTDVKDINTSINDVVLKSSALQNYHHTIDLEIASLNKDIKTTRDYQDILRKEVKALAENKLNTTTFWRNYTILETRVEWVEHHPV